ncbi:MAG: ABC transporter permease, partial [Bacteroidales bacterium]
TDLLEISGYSQNFSSGKSALRTQIIGIGPEFFKFHGLEYISIPGGTAAINEMLAQQLGLKQGDELIISFNPLSDIPASAPFAPEQKSEGSQVFTVSKILAPGECGNFSLGISQTDPLNVFVNRPDLKDAGGAVPGVNRLIVSRSDNQSVSEIYGKLKEILEPEDIGLQIRHIPATGGNEIISSRIFIDQVIVDQVRKNIPSAYPVITYLCNDFSAGIRSTPYSFVSALPGQLYPGIPVGNDIVISRWLADDLSAKEGDSIFLSWYSPDPLNRLVTETGRFRVTGVADMEGIWSDSLLMPEFPGISGRESCSDWDAGVAINTDRIREKDEDYWNRYRGTPKAFINYETGRKLWGNNFGPATSIRFPAGVSEIDILDGLKGRLDPSITGFTVTNPLADSVRAAREGVNFSTLFLSLGFFIILSAFILLVLVLSSYYDSKRNQVIIQSAIGFSNRQIQRMILLESGITAFMGSAAGAVAGWVFNILLVKALNSVWQGAVQTNAIKPDFNITYAITGFLITFIASLTVIWFRSASFLKKLGRNEARAPERPQVKKNLIFFISFLFAAALLIAGSFLTEKYSSVFSFSGGALIFLSLILLFRHMSIRNPDHWLLTPGKRSRISNSYYAFNSSKAIAPVIFIAAGLFAVIITGVNRISINDRMLGPSGGTGGFVLWGESAIPIKEDLNRRSGRLKLGLDGEEFTGVTFVQGMKTSGNDASCLNLNHITTPPLLGLDPSVFIAKDAFSFASGIRGIENKNYWALLDRRPVNNTIYGIADQTVLEYGLKIKTGDTLKMRSETGETLNLVIAAGLKPSVFQGYVLIGKDNLSRYFPSVPGNQIFLVDGNRENTAQLTEALINRLTAYGVRFEPAGDRLAAFFVVTNTYLSVFSMLGGLGIILGVFGLGFVLLRNFTYRKREFALMMATGYSLRVIKKMILKEHLTILLAGVFTGILSALAATLHSLISNPDIPWKGIFLMTALVIVSGITALNLALRPVKSESLISSI